MRAIILIILFIYTVFAQGGNPIRNIFMQGNNINTVFRTDGIFNYDWVTFTTKEAGLLWPVTSPNRKTICYTSGIWIGTKVGPQRELRLAASGYASHFTPGNIPVIGQVPPQTVCTDTTWKGYYVQLTDPTLVNGGVRIKTAQGRQFTFRYDSWASWPVQKGAPYAEINNIPGYQPSWNSDRPGIGNGSKARPDELLFMVYMDYTNCTNNIHYSEYSSPGGTLPLGVEIHQISFMFNCPALINMYFIKYNIINKSNLIWDSAYVSFYNDIDIGDGSCGASDDANGCDTLRNIGFTYNTDNSDCNYGINPPSIGYRYLQGPLKFTGNNNDTAQLPYDTLIGYKLLRLTGYPAIYKHGDSCSGTPNNAVPAYYYLQGLNACGNPLINPITNLSTKFHFDGDACNRTGWFDSSYGKDVRDLWNTGPFSMNSGDTQVIVVSYNIGRESVNNFQNVCIMKNYSDSALKYYYNDFQTCIPIGIQPISSEVPERFMLYQNYPNPFNPVTKIKFDIPSLVRRGAGVVVLKIYDILGREISVLINEELKPGTYEVEWTAENYPSGVYFYTISSGDYFDSKKMILLK